MHTGGAAAVLAGGAWPVQSGTVHGTRDRSSKRTASRPGSSPRSSFAGRLSHGKAADRICKSTHATTRRTRIECVQSVESAACEAQATSLSARGGFSQEPKAAAQRAGPARTKRTSARAKSTSARAKTPSAQTDDAPIHNGIGASSQRPISVYFRSFGRDASAAWRRSLYWTM